METVNILGVHVNKYTMEEAVNLASLFLDEDGLSMIFTPNSEILLYASNNRGNLSFALPAKNTSLI